MANQQPTDPRTKEAIEFVESVTGEKFTTDFQTHLKSGQILCQLLNKLQPNSIPKVNTSKMPFKEMENIDAYIKACSSFIPSQYNFMTVDLYEGKNLNQVVQNLINVKRHFGYGFEKITTSTGNTILTDLAEDHTTQGSGLAPGTNATPIVIDESLSKTLGSGLKPGIQELTTKQLTPECSTCGQRISSSFVNACAKSWHQNCFVCKRCGTKLSNSKYYEEQGKPYCEKCSFIIKPHKPAVTAQTKDMGFSFE